MLCGNLLENCLLHILSVSVSRKDFMMERIMTRKDNNVKHYPLKMEIE